MHTIPETIHHYKAHQGKPNDALLHTNYVTLKIACKNMHVKICMQEHDKNQMHVTYLYKRIHGSCDII